MMRDALRDWGRRAAWGLLAAWAAAGPAAAGERGPLPSAGEVITNQDVVRLVKAPVNPELIRDMIENSAVDFDLSVDAILRLVESGVGDELVTLMRRRMKEQGEQREQVLRNLVRRLGNPDPAVRQSALAGLRRQGNNAVPFLEAMLADNVQPEQRGGAVWGIGELGMKASAPLLVPLLTDANLSVCLAAADALVKLETPEALAAARRILDDRDARPEGAIRYLGGVRDAASILKIEQRLLFGTEWQVRREAARALGQFTDSPHLRIDLETALAVQAETSAVRIEAINALARFRHPASVARLAEAALANRDPAVREAVFRAMGEFAPRHAAPWLIREMLPLKDRLTPGELVVINESLRRLTMANFGNDAIRWLNWLHQHEDTLPAQPIDVQIQALSRLAGVPAPAPTGPLPPPPDLPRPPADAPRPSGPAGVPEIHLVADAAADDGDVRSAAPAGNGRASAPPALPDPVGAGPAAPAPPDIAAFAPIVPELPNPGASLPVAPGAPDRADPAAPPPASRVLPPPPGDGLLDLFGDAAPAERRNGAPRSAGSARLSPSSEPPPVAFARTEAPADVLALFGQGDDAGTETAGGAARPPVNTFSMASLDDLEAVAPLVTPTAPAAAVGEPSAIIGAVDPAAALSGPDLAGPAVMPAPASPPEAGAVGVSVGLAVPGDGPGRPALDAATPLTGVPSSFSSFGAPPPVPSPFDDPPAAAGLPAGGLTPLGDLPIPDPSATGAVNVPLAVPAPVADPTDEAGRAASAPPADWTIGFPADGAARIAVPSPSPFGEVADPRPAAPPADAAGTAAEPPMAIGADIVNQILNTSRAYTDSTTALVPEAAAGGAPDPADAGTGAASVVPGTAPASPEPVYGGADGPERPAPSAEGATFTLPPGRPALPEGVSVHFDGPGVASAGSPSTPVPVPVPAASATEAQDAASAGSPSTLPIPAPTSVPVPVPVPAVSAAMAPDGDPPPLVVPALPSEPPPLAPREVELDRDGQPRLLFNEL